MKVNVETQLRAQGPGDVDVKRMIEVSDDKYQSDDGYVLQREYGLTPNGNSMNGRWVLRNVRGEMIDFNRYRNDIVEHHGLKLETSNELAEGCRKQALE